MKSWVRKGGLLFSKAVILYIVFKQTYKKHINTRELHLKALQVLALELTIL